MEKKSNNSSDDDDDDDDVEMLSFFSPAAAIKTSPRFLLLNLFLPFVVLVTKPTEEEVEEETRIIIGCILSQILKRYFSRKCRRHQSFLSLLFRLSKKLSFSGLFSLGFGLISSHNERPILKSFSLVSTKKE